MILPTKIIDRSAKVAPLIAIDMPDEMKQAGIDRPKQEPKKTKASTQRTTSKATQKKGIEKNETPTKYSFFGDTDRA